MDKERQFAESVEDNAEKPEEIDVSTDIENKKTEDLNALQTELQEARDKYLRLYAELDNYKKKTQKDKEELIKYSNESLVYELLPAIDSLEMALKHSSEGNAEALQSLSKGVENTLRELKRTLEKFGLTEIAALDRPFDPAYHHAMSQVAKDNADDNTVVEEYRKGYIFREKVLRPSLVAVSRKQ